MARSFNSKSPPTFYLKSISCFIGDGKLIPKLVFFFSEKKKEKYLVKHTLAAYKVWPLLNEKESTFHLRPFIFTTWLLDFSEVRTTGYTLLKKCIIKSFLILYLATFKSYDKMRENYSSYQMKIFFNLFLCNFFFFLKKNFTLSLYSTYSLALAQNSIWKPVSLTLNNEYFSPIYISGVFKTMNYVLFSFERHCTSL